MNLLELTSADHLQGSKEAPVVLIEYGDFQCPYCRKAYFIVKELQEKLGERLLFVYRHYPLYELHPQAVHAALAAEASGEHFWKMYAELFENQRFLDDASLLRYAQVIGLDDKQFRQTFSAPDTIAKVKADVESGNSLGVDGTPTFFVNGRRFEGNWMNSEEFLKGIEAMIH
jgi:protein-disulfide isomerase